MLVYLDTNIVIYLVEHNPILSEVAAARVAGLRSAGAQMVVSELVRMEARVRPIRTGDANILADHEAFFESPELVWSPFVRPVFDRATQIRAHWRFRPEDSLHIAAAVEAGCEVFLTNDARLQGFEGMRVEVLG